MENKRIECRVVFEKENNWGGKPKRYSYLTDIEDLKEGDPIIVDANGSYVVAYFHDYEATGRGTKWIIDKIDIERHKKLIDQEQAYQAREKERQAIKQQMIARKNKLEEEAIFKLLAETDPVMAELIKKLEEI